MKIATISKVAMCVCPPAIVATTAVTVPPVRRAVHHLTAPRHVAHAHRPRRHVLARNPCGPGGPGGGAAPAALRTFADQGPSDLAGPSSPFVDAGSIPGGLLPGLSDAVPGDYRDSIAPSVGTPGGIVPAVTGGGGGTPPVTAPTTGTGDTPATGAVPEPLTWVMMLFGIGGTGIALRGRHVGGKRRRSGTRTAIAGLSTDAATMLPNGQLSAAASTAGAGAKSTKAALLAKAALCVCPPALLATSVATVPPVRHAVYAATGPRTHARPVAAALPCDSAIAAAATPAAPSSRRQGRAVARPTAGRVDGRQEIAAIR